MHNVHLDRLEASTRTFFIPGVNNVHLDRAEASRCTLRTVALPYQAAVDVRRGERRTTSIPTALDVEMYVRRARCATNAPSSLTEPLPLDRPTPRHEGFAATAE